MGHGSQQTSMTMTPHQAYPNPWGCKVTTNQETMTFLFQLNNELLYRLSSLFRLTAKYSR